MLKRLEALAQRGEFRTDQPPPMPSHWQNAFTSWPATRVRC